MADPVGSVNAISTNGLAATYQEAGPRDIPENRIVPKEAEQSGLDGVSPEAQGFDEMVVFRGVLALATMIPSMLTQRMADARKLQDDAHNQIRETENENGG